jgi:hypothetical protein
VLEDGASHIETSCCFKAAKAWGAVDLTNAVAITIKQQINPGDFELHGGSAG